MLRTHLEMFPRNPGERNQVAREKKREESFPGYTLNLEPQKCIPYLKELSILRYAFLKNSIIGVPEWLSC